MTSLAPRAPRAPRARRMVIVVFDGVQSLDLTGPMEVFAGADRYARARLARSPGYDITIAAMHAGALVTSGGLTIVPDAALADVADLDDRGRPIDTLVVAGGDGINAAIEDRVLVDHIRALARSARRVTSVCSGAFLLAEAGLLDGRRATTHWSRCAELADRYPAVQVEPDPIFTRDGNVLTSAGVTAGMDLALALVEDDLGREAALTIARFLVLFLHRPGDQAQFSSHLRVQLADRDELRALQQWIAEHPDADCSVDALAERAAMSARHLARTFVDQIGTTPARYVEQVRIESARRRLEESTDSVERVAASCGFATAETMRRSFVRALGVAPTEYRRRFRTAIA